MPVIDGKEYRDERRTNVVQGEDGRPETPEEWDYEEEVPDYLEDPGELAVKAAQLIGVTPSQFVEFAIRMPNKKANTYEPFSFLGREYLRMPYDVQSKRVLLMCGRQVEKTTMLGNKSLAYACVNNAFNILYVSPTNQQTKVFSQDRLKEPIETSEVLKAWTTTKLSDNVFLKKFINRSQITLRYAYHNADRVRGIPADLILIDELQDILTDNIPVIEECASHSPHKYFGYSGTPKSYDNSIEKYWTEFSTQNEWVVPCYDISHVRVVGDTAVGAHWNVLGERNITREGLACDVCGKLIDASGKGARWVSMNPSLRESMGADGLFEGFRIPQLMVPWIPWVDIWDKRQRMSPSKFHNEVLGLSYDTGTRPLTREDLKKNCNQGQMMTQESLVAYRKSFGDGAQVYAGIDWGSGENTYTVISLGAYLNGFFNVFYIHRFEHAEIEPTVQISLISQLINYWNVKLVGTDYGGGHDRNDALARKFGRKRIIKYQYSNPGQKVRWEEGLYRFLVHRTEVMSDIFNAIKRGDVFRFPDWSAFEDPFAQDMLNIFSEYNEQMRQIQYKKSKDVADDSFHSLLYCFLASMLHHPRFDVMNPEQKVGVAIPEFEV